MSCGGVPDALCALGRHWLSRIDASLIVVDTHLRSALHIVASTASVLLSFESLVVVSFLTFLFLGGTLAILVLWPIIIESDRDDYDDCERGVYYAESGDGKWVGVGVAVPVILVDRNRRGKMDRILVPASPRPHRNNDSDKRHDGRRH